MPNAPTGIKRVSEWCVVGIFLAVIYGSWLDTALHLDPMRPPSENRALAAMPPWPSDASRLGGFAAEFFHFVQDNFGFRSLLLSWNSSIRLALGQSPSPSVMLGKDGWLYYTGNHALEDYRGLWPLSPEDIDAWCREIAQRRVWLADRSYVFLIAPEKTEIYPEYLPGTVGRRSTVSVADQIDAALRVQDGFALTSPRQALIRAKPLGLVYYKTDTHWTPLGLQVVADVVRNQISGPDDRSSPASSAIDQEVVRETGGDLTGMLNAPGRYTETLVRSQPHEVSRFVKRDEEVVWFEPMIDQSVRVVVQHVDRGGPGRRAMMFGDSFGEELARYLAPHFAEFIYVPMHPDTASFKALVNRFAPDVVIEERAERYMKYAPRQAPFADRRLGWMAAE